MNEMTRAARELKEKAESHQKAADESKSALERIQSQCKHSWSESRYTPIVREAYTTPGDPKGTMGVDWQGPQYVPRQVTKQWTRECFICLLVQVTQQIAKETVEKPKW